jgi:two-component system sensor histidine kinase HydH
MGHKAKHQYLKILPDGPAVLVIMALIVGTTAAHYLTSHDVHTLHGIYRRIYYIPIIITALQFGLYESLAAAAVITLLYVPHAFLAHFMDPGTTTEKILEIVLYFTVALVTGVLQMLLKREVARREETERELRLKDRLTSLGELSAGFAHEIRNPTGSIKGAAQLLLDYFPEDDSKKKLARLLVKESDRLEETVNRFLEFARPSVAVVPDLDLGEILSETADLLRQHGEAEGKEIVITLPEGPASVEADPTLLKQVFFNIGLNGLQAMERGGELAVELRRRGDMWAAIFRDRGCGIDPESLDRLFDPFFTTKEKGTGLGLSVSYRIVQEHGGDIAVETRRGEGSTFTVLLPMRGRGEAGTGGTDHD